MYLQCRFVNDPSAETLLSVLDSTGVAAWKKKALVGLYEVGRDGWTWVGGICILVCRVRISRRVHAAIVIYSRLFILNNITVDALRCCFLIDSLIC